MKDNIGMLSPYRVLDLTDEKGLLCGKLLGDLGADVIKVEPPEGDAARCIGPFYHDEPDPEKSLFWFAFNTSKRGVTIDLETPTGRDLFLKLLSTADVVVESFAPGYLDRLGLGYPVLAEANRGIILVSVTPFGQSGPYRDYKAPDIVAWAMGGEMFPFGDADRPPIRIAGHSQAYLHAGLEAAVGVMLALFQRLKTGRGQTVDVSVQAAVARRALHVSGMWDMERIIWPHGMGITLAHVPDRPPDAAPPIKHSPFWTCRDGYLSWIYWFGPMAHLNRRSMEWMESEGLESAFLRDFDASTISPVDLTPELYERVKAPVAEFFATRTRADLLKESLAHGVSLYPVSGVNEILENAHRQHLLARGFWEELDHPELGARLVYPGAFGRMSAAPARLTRRAPRIGEHNKEVFEALAATPRQPETEAADSHNPRPLEGVKVADFTWALAGPITGKTLADAGASVVKIEGRSRIDQQRTAGFFKDRIRPEGVNGGSNFNIVNTSKMSVAVNLGLPGGIKLARKFAAWADVVIDNFAGGVMDRLGLGYEELRKLNPGLIMLSSSMMGAYGPNAWLGGLGTSLAALGGVNEITGYPDREPQSVGPYTDFAAPHFSALAILAALDHRRRTGQGQFIDMSQYENTIHLIAPLLLDYQANGRVAGRVGNRIERAAPHSTFRCRGEERWCAIAVFKEAEWAGFRDIIGRAAWTDDARFASLAARKEHEDELNALVEAWTLGRAAEEVMTLMQAAGVAAGVVATAEDLMERDPQLKHRGFFATVPHPEVGEYRTPTSACVLSRAPCEPTRAPLLGEHNEYALRELLGLSEDDIAEYVIGGALE